jgi:hypothetical protein
VRLYSQTSNVIWPARNLHVSNLHVTISTSQALRAAFSDFTRHEVARLREELLYSSTLDAKLKTRLARKLQLVQKEIDAAEQMAIAEANGEVYGADDEATIVTGLTRESTKARLQHKHARAERLAATSAQLRSRLTARLAGIEAEVRAQTQQDTVILQSVDRFEEQMVRLRSLLQAIPNSADKEKFAEHTAAKNASVQRIMIELEKLEFFCKEYEASVVVLPGGMKLGGGGGAVAGGGSPMVQRGGIRALPPPLPPPPNLLIHDDVDKRDRDSNPAEDGTVAGANAATGAAQDAGVGAGAGAELSGGTGANGSGGDGGDGGSGHLSKDSLDPTTAVGL